MNVTSGIQLFILGYMASGKTTFGKALARMTDSSFVDLDDYIEEKEGRNISEIFAVEGEEGFRKIEGRRLREVSDSGVKIISCGGGTPCFSGNMDFMQSRGVTLWLKVGKERLMERLLEERAKRPLVAQLTPEKLALRIDSDLSKREPHYEKATVTFSGEHLDNAHDIAESVRKFTEAFPQFGFAITKALM